MASAYSDEEFQDAVSTADDTTSSSSKSTKTSEQIEDLTKELHEAKINKEEDEEADEFKPALENEDDDDNNEEEAAEELSIEELQRLEKDMTAEQLEANKKKAEEMKLDANELFKNDKPEEAIHLYSEALNICPSANSKERAILFANRAAAKIKIDAKKSAVEDCTKAIELWPEYVRCLLRRAKLYETLDKLDEALEDYKRIADLDPGQREAREAMVRLPPIIAERNEKLKAEMVGKLKDLGNMFLKPFGLSTANFQMQQDPNSGSYSINFKQ